MTIDDKLDNQGGIDIASGTATAASVTNEGVDLRKRSVRVVGGEVSIPNLFEKENSGRTADLLTADDR